eukprot:NODE_489_length_6860_cov_1.209289.p7 type:complete len:113 gc:universal NODE_489_length_6860_cov_1.209289:3113-3451(+)
MILPNQPHFSLTLAEQTKQKQIQNQAHFNLIRPAHRNPQLMLQKLQDLALVVMRVLVLNLICQPQVIALLNQKLRILQPLHPLVLVSTLVLSPHNRLNLLPIRLSLPQLDLN